METIISILTRFVADTVWCCTDSPRVVDTFPNGNVMTLALTCEPGRATWITRRDYEFNGSPLYWHRTAYDAEDRPTETTDSLSSTREWCYNCRSELVGASGTQAHPYDYAYSYDSIGNRLTASDGSGTIPYTSNELNQYTSLYLRGETLLYDADGNLTQDNSRDFAYSYDDENRLVSVTPANPVYGSRAIENVYDHRCRRIKKIVRHYDGSGMGWNVESTHVFVWDGWNIVLEQITFADNTTSTIEYFWGNDLSGTEEGAGGVGGLLATRIDGVFYVPVYGGNGNIMMYVAGNGWIAAQYDYDPYGNIRQSSGPLASQFAFGFSTKYHDREVGLVAYQLRTYNPTYGRWLNRDPIEEAGGENLYMSAGNCFTTKVDPYGLSEYVLGDRVVRFGQLNSSTWDSEKEFGLFNNLTQVWAWNSALVTVGGGKVFGLNASAGMLWHFLDDSGDLMIVSIDQILKENYFFSVFMRGQINQAMIFAEKLVCKNKVPTLISATEMDPFVLAGLNWGYAIHGFSSSARALVTKCGKKYQMSWHFYLHDLYDWDLHSKGRGGLVTDRQMAMLHRNGFAREYPVSGRYDIEVSWQKGERLKSNFYEKERSGMVSPNYVLIR